MNTIEQLIRKIAAEKGLSQTVLADAMNITQPGLSKLLNGKDNVKFMYLKRFADYLGISVIDLITYPEKWGPVEDKQPCQKCYEKDLIINNLNDLLQRYRKEINELKAREKGE